MKRLLEAVAVCALALALALLVAPMLGPEKIDPRRAFAGESPYREILFAIRIPRTLLAAVAGGALAVAGLLFQAIIRNPLADPYTLGVSSGSSLGAVLAICFGWNQLFGMPAIGISAFLGAICVVALVMAIASRGGKMSSFTLLLSGVTFNSLTIAALLFLHTIANYTQSFQIVRWLMGGLESPSYSSILWLSVIVFPTAVFVFLRSRDWNLLAVGEQWTEARGVSTQRLLRVGLLLASLLTASVTCLTGPIGFLGWSIPHALRLWLGADHRLLIPCAFLLGGAFLVLCDTIARVLLAPSEIPIGAVTSLLAGPFFLWLLSSRKRGML